MDVGNLLDGMVVLITGGSGCIGQALTTEIIQHYTPRKLIILSRSESRQAAMRETFPETGPMRYYVGDVRDRQRMLDACEGVDIVIHAAALKRVEVCEREPKECALTNVFGTLNVAEAARTCGVRRFMFVSSDKSCQAATIYGGSKYLAERMTIAMNSYSGTRYSAVRYGNVLGSTGSVLQAFRAANGRVPIVDRRMTRFWLTAQSAARFNLSSLTLMRGGETFVPKLPAASVLTLAEAFAPERGIEVVGMVRGVEKIHESMLSSDEAPWVVELPDRYLLLPAMPFWSGGDWSEAKRVPAGFSYTSENAPERLTAEQLREMAGMD